MPIQDVFGWRDRDERARDGGRRQLDVRLPWPCDRLDDIPEARERARAAGWAAITLHQRRGDVIGTRQPGGPRARVII